MHQDRVAHIRVDERDTYFFLAKSGVHHRHRGWQQPIHGCLYRDVSTGDAAFGAGCARFDSGHGVRDRRSIAAISKRLRVRHRITSPAR